MRLMFISMFLALCSLNYYIGIRFWQYLGQRVSFLDIRTYWVIFALIAFSGMLSIVMRGYLPDFMRNGFYLFGSYWLAVMFYSSLIFALFDLMRNISKYAGILQPAFTQNGVFRGAWSFFTASAAPGIIALVLVVFLLAYGTWNARNIRAVSYEVNIHKEVENLSSLQMVLVADLHLGAGVNTNRRAEKLVNAINSLEPDIVVIPGDIIDDFRSFEQLGLGAELRKIKSKYGVFATLGNHDYMSRDFTRHLELLEEAGIKVLRDSSVKVAESFYILGREDSSFSMGSGKKRLDPAALTQDLDPGLPLIMLEHKPDDILKVEEADVDLLLTGHTHKGQFFPVNLITSRIFTIDYGYLATEGGLQVIVTSGANTWGPPIRIGSSCEILQIRVSFSGEE